MKGIRINNGCIEARITIKGQLYRESFGADCPDAREAAEIWLGTKKRQKRDKTLGITQEMPQKTFLEVSKIWFDVWSKETTPEGHLQHGKTSIAEVSRLLKKDILPVFGQRKFDTIRPVDVKEWRLGLLNRGVSGTGANRYQAVLSSLFNGINQAIKAEEIAPFKLPVDPQTGNYLNPCDHVEKAPNVKRKRILSVLELRRLYQSCISRNDKDLWEICEMALKSVLRKKDLFALDKGEIDTIQAKTNRPIHLPIQVLNPLNYVNFNKRWKAARKSADLIDVQFRDLRKTGATYLKNKKHNMKHISEFLGHADLDTTEIYMVEDVEHLKPLAEDLAGFVEMVKK